MSNTNYPVHTIAPDCYLIDEFGLGTAYLLVGSERALLIDCGTGVADLRGLVERLTDKPYDLVATHFHMDHVGGCTQFSEMYIHPDDMSAVDPSVQGRAGYGRRMQETYPHLKDAFSIDDIAQGPLPKMIPIREGHVFPLGDRQIETFEVPGHTRGSLVFLDRKNRIMISGDAMNPIFLLVMEAPTRKDAAASFLSAAKRIAAMKGDFDAMYGGHCDKEPLDPQVLPDLIRCAQGIVDGTLPPERKKVHIFEADFYSVGLVNVMLEHA